MLNIELKWDLEQLKATGFVGKMDRVLLLLIEKMNEVSEMLLERVHEKLSGEVLERKSGKLFDSAHVVSADLSGDETVRGGVTAGGAEAMYGIYQEMGVEHPWNVVAVNVKALHFLADGKSVFAHHAKHPGLPMRSFMASTAEEERLEILDGLASAVQEGLLNAE